MAPTTLSASREPNLSPGGPASSAPRNVPTSPLATAKPAQKLPGARWNTLRMDSVTPEITTVSKPNSSPAREAVTMTPRFPFFPMTLPPLRRLYIEWRLLIQNTLVIVRHRIAGVNHETARFSAAPPRPNNLAGTERVVRLLDQRAARRRRRPWDSRRDDPQADPTTLIP